jgi:ribonuclease HI
MILIQEPVISKRNGRVQGWGTNPNQNPSVVSPASRVVTVCTDPDIGNIHVASACPDSYAVNLVTWKGLHLLLVNIYLKPKTDITDTLSALSSLISSRSDRNIIIAGDWNSRHMMWGDAVNDRRSGEVLTFLAEHDLEVQQNTSDIPTFIHNNAGHSYIDFVATRIRDPLSVTVTTLPEVTHDHRPLRITITSQVNLTSELVRRYNVKKADWQKFSDELTAADMNMITDLLDVDECWQAVKQWIIAAADSAIPKKRARQNKTRFWNETLSRLRRERNTAHKNWIRIRHRNSQLADQYKDRYSQATSEYKKKLKSEKLTSFKEFIERESASDPWSIAYKICRDKLPSLKSLIAQNSTDSVEQAMDNILKHFFPQASDKISFDTDHPPADNDRPLKDHEIKAAIMSMSLDKSPGADMITGRILRAAYESCPEPFHALYKLCFDRRLIPKEWKEAVLAVIPKPGKESYTSLSSFRPVSLLSVPGKVIDRLLISRVTHFMYKSPSSARKQYAFKPQNSTEDAINEVIRFTDEKAMTHYVMLIALDIKSAFDTARHEVILERMREAGVPDNLIRLTDSFFTDRKVHLMHESLCQTRELNQGCPQGSVSGPSLWNILMDGIFEITSDPDVNIVCFADDTMIQVRAMSQQAAHRKAEQMISLAMDWCDEVRLKLNMDKTEVMLVPTKIRPEARSYADASDLTVTHNGITHTIKPVTKFKYLGVILDSRLNFADHINHISGKATKVIWQLARAARHDWGFSPEIMRTLYQRCIEPITVYGCSIWGHRVQATISNTRRIVAVQRLMLIRTTRAYRTVSHAALCAITGVLPIDLKIRELIDRRHEIRTGTDIERPIHYSQFLHPASDHRIPYENHDPDTWPADVCIFTDGSKTTNDVTCAFVVYNKQEESDNRQYRLAPECSVFQAEMTAIVQAVEWLNDNFYSEAAILTDSLSALQAVHGSDMSNPLVYKLKSLILTYGWLKVRLYHTRAHIGTTGNERAHTLATNVRPEITDFKYSLEPVSSIKSWYRKESARHWKNQWRTGDTGRLTHRLAPNLSVPVPLHIVSYQTMQILTGHGSFGQYLARFNVRQSADCYCGAAVCDVLHLLTECPTHCPNLIQQHFAGKDLSNMSDIFSDPELTDAFVKISKDHSRMARNFY